MPLPSSRYAASWAGKKHTVTLNFRSGGRNYA